MMVPSSPLGNGWSPMRDSVVASPNIKSGASTSHLFESENESLSDDDNDGDEDDSESAFDDDALDRYHEFDVDSINVNDDKDDKKTGRKRQREDESGKPLHDTEILEFALDEANIPELQRQLMSHENELSSLLTPEQRNLLADKIRQETSVITWCKAHREAVDMRRMLGLKMKQLDSLSVTMKSFILSLPSEIAKRSRLDLSVLPRKQLKQIGGSGVVRVSKCIRKIPLVDNDTFRFGSTCMSAHYNDSPISADRVSDGWRNISDDANIMNLFMLRLTRSYDDHKRDVDDPNDQRSQDLRKQITGGMYAKNNGKKLVRINNRFFMVNAVNKRRRLSAIDGGNVNVDRINVNMNGGVTGSDNVNVNGNGNANTHTSGHQFGNEDIAHLPGNKITAAMSQTMMPQTFTSPQQQRLLSIPEMFVPTMNAPFIPPSSPVVQSSPITTKDFGVPLSPISPSLSSASPQAPQTPNPFNMPLQQRQSPLKFTADSNPSMLDALQIPPSLTEAISPQSTQSSNDNFDPLDEFGSSSKQIKK